jgi:putative oxidoreductase
MGEDALKTDLGLLILRLAAGGFMATHGWGKAARLLQGNTQFADPLGLGPLPSLILVAFAELICASAVALGIYTRAAAIPVAIAMAVAGFVQHAQDPFAKKELALLFCAVFLSIALLGGGRYALENYWTKLRRKKAK